MNQLGRKIKILRKNLNIKQEDITCEILSRTILSKIENNKVTPSIYQLNHIARKLGVSVDYFLNTESLFITSNKNNTLKMLYENESYLTIINKYEKKQISSYSDPGTTFYIGYSYYKVGYNIDGLKFLSKYIKEVTTLNQKEFLGQIENLVKAYNVLGVDYYFKENWKKSLENYLKCTELLETYHKTSELIYAQIINNIGTLYYKSNEYIKCIKLLEEFLKQNSIIIHTHVYSCIHVCLSSAYYNIMEYDKSINHIEKAIFFYNYLNDDVNAIECHLNYINALRYSKYYNEALKVIEDVFTNYKEHFDEPLKISFTMQKAILYFNLDDYDNCSITLKGLNIKQLDSYNRGCYYFLKGRISYVNNHSTNAATYYKKCISLFSASNYIDDLKIIYTDLLEITKFKKYKTLLEEIEQTTNAPRKNIVVP